MDPFVGALTFRREIYEEAKSDSEFTATAWLLVVFIALVNQMGLFASGFAREWIIKAVVGSFICMLGFALFCLVILGIARLLFRSSVTFSSLVRTLALAWVWNLFAGIGILIPAVPALVFPSF